MYMCTQYTIHVHVGPTDRQVKSAHVQHIPWRVVYCHEDKGIEEACHQHAQDERVGQYHKLSIRQGRMAKKAAKQDKTEALLNNQLLPPP